MNETILIIILLFIIILFVFMHFKEVKYIESYKGTKYLVRNCSDSKKAADLLQEIVDKLTFIVDYGMQHHNKELQKYVETIDKKFSQIKFRESTSKNKFTSYSVNKGEEIVLCLRCKKTNKLHNINEILYVAIHEVAHVGCPEVGHTPLFTRINKLLLEYGLLSGVYNYKNYDLTPEEYCGIEINTSLLNSSSLINK
jgi:hypothetical protein